MRMFLLKTWRDALARKGQFGALVLLVMLGILSYVAFISGYIDLSASLEQANTELRYADFATRVISAPASAIDRFRKVPGVRYAEAALVRQHRPRPCPTTSRPRHESSPSRPTGHRQVNRLHYVEGAPPQRRRVRRSAAAP